MMDDTRGGKRNVVASGSSFHFPPNKMTQDHGKVFDSVYRAMQYLGGGGLPTGSADGDRVSLAGSKLGG